MREIKFREWDAQRGTISYGEREDFDDMIGFRFEHTENVDGDLSKERVLEQYTGLRDKNDREIYEGDIVKLHVVILSPDDKIGYIEYRPEFGYCINFGKSIARQEYWAANDKHTIEVIGNIHENPELLEKTGVE
ncbi:hypothetical protein FFRU_260090 [Fructobacillus fructosus]|nr:YopX family protein [Fructobacillus fructosus]GAP02027.1 hypothetical protein FFRU_260090 [Fructobacillus fructosus]